MKTGSKVSICLCEKEGRRWPAGEEGREDRGGVWGGLETEREGGERR